MDERINKDLYNPMINGDRADKVEGSDGDSSSCFLGVIMGE
jgi:hypothetical protein